MQKILTLYILLCTAMLLSAQENMTTTLQPATTSPATELKPALDSLELAAPDKPALELPVLTDLGTMPAMRWPWAYYGGWHSWRLHEGINVSLGASVFSTFGSGNTWSGAGFSQNISLQYATALSKRLSLAIGGYLYNTTWAHDTYRDAGMSATLNYRFDDHWSAFMYGQKSLVQNKPLPLPLQDFGDMGDRLGIGVRYDFSPSFSVAVSFETQKYNNVPYYFDDDRRR